MATLQVTNLQNTAATVNNISLLADGTTSLVLNATGTARTGGIRYVGGFLEVYTSGGVWVPVAPGVAATLAEAAAGTLNTVFSSPLTAVPKDAAGMTGAAILPSGTDAQRAAIAAPTVGMQRFNTTSGYEEVYTGATNGWRQLDYYTPITGLTDLIVSANGVLPNGGYYENIIVNAGVTATALTNTSLRARTSIQINGTINVQAASPGAPGQGVATSSGVGAITSQIGQGFGQLGSTYGFGSQISTGGAAATFIVDSGSGTGSGGGYGGGSLILRSEGTFTMGAAAVISANGSPGTGGVTTPGTLGVQIPGGGGGSGGLIYVEASVSISLDAGSRLYAIGGAGYTGFAGGSRAGDGAGGGGGGGGGYIVLTSPATTSVAANFDVSGGAAGADFGGAAPAGPAFLGQWGASWGGAGGDPNSGVWPNTAAAGAAGQVIYNAFLN